MSHSFETVDYRTALPPTTPAYPTQYTRQPNKPPFLQQQLHIFGEFFWYQIVPSLHWSINDVQLRLQAEPVMAGADSMIYDIQYMYGFRDYMYIFLAQTPDQTNTV